VGRGGPFAGHGASLLVIDDPLKNAAEARSKLVRDATFEWYLADARTRVHAGGAIILISTRWHEDDPAGRILRQGDVEPWDVLSLSAIAEIDESFRREGGALWPEVYDLSELEKIRNEIGAANFISLYQQHPSAIEGRYLSEIGGNLIGSRRSSVRSRSLGTLRLRQVTQMTSPSARPGAFAKPDIIYCLCGAIRWSSRHSRKLCDC
jgi:hypothetical protein